jgi:hypothetical protein
VRDYYAELPITLRVTGKYHDMGAFASDIANLSRIVTLNNLTIVPRPDGSLTMDATAKTFRYLDQRKWLRSARRPEAPRNESARISGVVLLCLMLAACGGGNSDELQQWMADSATRRDPRSCRSRAQGFQAQWGMAWKMSASPSARRNWRRRSSATASRRFPMPLWWRRSWRGASRPWRLSRWTR